MSMLAVLSEGFLFPAIGALVAFVAGVWLFLHGKEYWKRILGAYLIAIAIVVPLQPRLWAEYMGMLGAYSELHSDAGVALYTNLPDPATDEALWSLIRNFRPVFERRFLGLPEQGECPLKVVALRASPASMPGQLVLKRQGYGYYHDSFFTGPTVVYPQDSGIGSLTHHMVYRYLGCAKTDYFPPWLGTSLATLFEKFIVDAKEGEVQFSFGYRSNWRDAALRGYLETVSLEHALASPTDQNVLQSFALYLYHHGWIRPLIEALKLSPQDYPAALSRVTGLSIAALDADWKRWMNGEALRIPRLYASIVQNGSQQECQQRTLKAQGFEWDSEHEVWRAPPGDPQATIFPCTR